jgi:hypothetical protein
MDTDNTPDRQPAGTDYRFAAPFRASVARRRHQQSGTGAAVSELGRMRARSYVGTGNRNGLVGPANERICRAR